MDSLKRIKDLVKGKAFQDLRKETVLFARHVQRERDDRAFLGRMAAVMSRPVRESK